MKEAHDNGCEAAKSLGKVSYTTILPVLLLILLGILVMLGPAALSSPLGFGAL
jgi:thiosulfate reductase cytochrome b subunit